MLQDLKFVQGAVSKKNFVPELTHFQIKDGWVKGFNGKITLASPIALDIDCCPKAASFVAAVQACEETADLHLTKTGKLSIRSGAFRAYVETLADNNAYPDIRPEGEEVSLDGDLMPALRMLYPITAEDASRPWAAGLLLDGNTATATNNVLLVQHWLDFHFPHRINIPRSTIAEMLRIGEEPKRVFVTGTSVTFFYNKERWLRSPLHSVDWPDIAGMLDKAPHTNTQVNGDMWEALDTITPFLGKEGRVYLTSEGISTAKDEEGASIKIPLGDIEASVNCQMLRLLQGIALTIGFESWPAPIPFYGAKTRGLFAGMTA